MISILNAEPKGYCQSARNLLAEIGDYQELYLDRDMLLACVGEYDVLITRLGFQIDEEIIEAGRNLKYIVTATTGLDHIDLIYAKKKGITVLSLKDEIAFLNTIHATSEHTWALLLTLLRNIPHAHFSVLDGYWDRDNFRGFELHGRHLGILGLGRVGSQVANYGFAFGMEVIAYDPYVNDWKDLVIRCKSINELFSSSDVLSVHIPLNTATNKLINLNLLNLMPKKSFLINTSRADIIDENDLLISIQSGNLAGAALDFVSSERDSQTRNISPLIAYARKNKNLLITPHLGGATFESMQKTETYMARKLMSVIQNSL
jgi:D-3-phosphoglycerate dehydrogenase / 2-oxoglutarate reductase